MIKILTIFTLLLASDVIASTSIDEKFVATFSDYNQFDKMVTCTPGYRGPYPTFDILKIKAHAVDIGLSISDEFMAFSNIGLREDPSPYRNGGGGIRPYNAGCKAAIEQLKAAIKGKEVVEVTVNRTVSVSPKTNGRVYRKVDGEVLRVQYVTSEQRYESFKFELGGFEFQAGQIQNGKSELR